MTAFDRGRTYLGLLAEGCWSSTPPAAKFFLCQHIFHKLPAAGLYIGKKVTAVFPAVSLLVSAIPRRRHTMGAHLVGTVQCCSYPATSHKENIAPFESAGDVASAFVPQSREGGRRHVPSTP